MAKTNKFRVRKYDDEDSQITVEEERKEHSPFIWFLINNGRLIFVIALLFAIILLLIVGYFGFKNLKSSEVAYYVTNGVTVEFNGTDNSVIGGTPITSELADRLFGNNLAAYEKLQGAVIKIKEVKIKNGVIVFYSDKTALVKYDDGSYLRVFPVDNNYGIDENGMINSKAVTRNLTGEYRNNDKLGIELLYLSDGTVEVTKDDVTFFLRSTDLTSNDNEFYTNLSIISVPIKEEDGKVYYSNGIIKDGKDIIVDGKRYGVKNEVKIHDDITIIYYDNGYAEVIKDGHSIMVEKSDHIVYDDNILEIVDNSKDTSGLDNLLDVKDITLSNNNEKEMHYMVVLEETDDYGKHNVNRRLDNKFVHYSVSAGKEIIKNKILDNNIRGTNKLSGVDSNNNVYLIQEGTIEVKQQISIKVGMWIDYETITNDYMNAALIGTMKVYVEA